MAVTRPPVPSDRQTWINKDGTPTNSYFQYLKQLDAYVKALEARIAALESP